MPAPNTPAFTVTSPEGREITLHEASYSWHVGQPAPPVVNIQVVADGQMMNPGMAVAMLTWERDYWKDRAEAAETKLADMAAGETP